MHTWTVFSSPLSLHSQKVGDDKVASQSSLGQGQGGDVEGYGSHDDGGDQGVGDKPQGVREGARDGVCADAHKSGNVCDGKDGCYTSKKVYQGLHRSIKTISSSSGGGISSSSSGSIPC